MAETIPVAAAAAAPHLVTPPPQTLTGCSTCGQDICDPPQPEGPIGFAPNINVVAGVRIVPLGNNTRSAVHEYHSQGRDS